MKKVYIRVDGNEKIATGHVMRCLSIAIQLRKYGMKVVFLLADVRSKDLVEEKGFSVKVLDTTWNNLSEETEIICEFIMNSPCHALILDTYYITKDYLQKLSNYTKIIYIDDLLKFDYDVYTIIRYNPFVKKEDYLQLYNGSQKIPDLLLGSSYIPLREEFSSVTNEISKSVRKVLITMGGTDQLNVAGHIVDMATKDENCRELEYHIIVGKFNQNRDKLQKYSSKYNNIVIHENVVAMSQWMRKCDVAISAGGSTLYELCACGIPTICMEIADNQIGAIKWKENDYMEYVGNACKDMTDCVSKCVKYLTVYMRDYELRVRRSVKMQELVDGKGAMRIAKYIDELEGIRC